MPDLLFERDGHVAVLTMNRPQRKNALTLEMIQLMAEAWDEIDANDDIRVAVLTGRDGAYCAGADLSDQWALKAVKEEDGADSRSIEEMKAEAAKRGTVISKGLLLNHSLTKPLVAAVGGPCMGGGCEMLQQTDIRVAERQATFGLPEAQRGLIAGAGSTVRLKRQIPYTKAMEMLLTGNPLTAEEAYHFGLVGHLVDEGGGLPRAMELADRVAKNGPMAVRHAKAAAVQSGWLDEETARAIEQRFSVPVMRSADAAEGMNAFKEKRDPSFVGH